MADSTTSPDSVRPTRGDVGAGSSLGPYELLAPIAQGGMAVVWAARLKGHKGFQKLVAVKTMHKALTLDARFERMFLAEAEFASRIEHPNVCTIRDLGEQRGCLYLAMDWIDGETLASIESQHPSGLPIVIAALIGRDVALGLHSAHELESSRGEHLGLVHCDVSPQNILVAPDGVVKVVDFGLARATGAFRSLAFGERHVGGKMSFMSPEQGEGTPLDRRSDVFSLGIVLYRLVTGRHPFEGETSMMRFRRMRDQNEPLTAPHAFRSDCPVALSTAVARALEKHPARRFQSMKEFAQALEAAVPEIKSPTARDDLASFAEKAVGAAVKKRRAAITMAIEIANQRIAESEPEPISLPSTVLEEVDDDPPPALATTLPVAFSLAPVAARGRPLIWGSAAAIAIVGSTLLLWRTNKTPDSVSPVAPSFAAAPRSVSPEPPRAPEIGPNPVPSAAPATSAKPRAHAFVKAPAPVRPAASARDAWRYDPGF